jgi:hypothetical protein
LQPEIYILVVEISNEALSKFSIVESPGVKCAPKVLNVQKEVLNWNWGEHLLVEKWVKKSPSPNLSPFSVDGVGQV